MPFVAFKVCARLFSAKITYVIKCVKLVAFVNINDIFGIYIALI